MNQDLDAEKVTSFLNQAKRQMSQVDGEMATMRGDAMSGLFTNFANIMNQLYTQQMNEKKRADDLQAKLDKIYQGWPEVQKSIEAEPEKKKK